MRGRGTRTLRDLIEAYLIRNDRSKVALARELGIVPSLLWRWMRGVNTPRLGAIGRLARVLELPVEEVQAAVEAGRQQNTEGAVR